MKKVYQRIKGIKCSQCGGDLVLLGLGGNSSACLKCGIVYSTEILEEKLGHSINFKTDVEYIE